MQIDTLSLVKADAASPSARGARVPNVLRRGPTDQPNRRGAADFRGRSAV
jgi:hypothetical protein